MAQTSKKRRMQFAQMLVCTLWSPSRPDRAGPGRFDRLAVNIKRRHVRKRPSVIRDRIENKSLTGKLPFYEQHAPTADMVLILDECNMRKSHSTFFTSMFYYPKKTIFHLKAI